MQHVILCQMENRVFCVYNATHFASAPSTEVFTHGKGRRCLSGMIVDKSVSHAAAAFFVCLEDSFVHEALNFAEGGVVACVE